MKYDFTTFLDRKGKDSLAFDSVGMEEISIAPMAPDQGFDFIPMWVADMSFPTCPSIIKAITDRASHPAFGYYLPSDKYYDAIINWHTKSHGFTDLTKEKIGYENGVHGLCTSAVQVLTQPGDYILLHSPVYVGYRSDVEALGRKSIYSPLVLDEDGIWRMDYEDMDRKLKKYNIHLSIFCSPHNPSGRVWEKWELEKALEVYEKNDCYVISDEIWCDIIMPGHTHTPMITINDWAREHVIGAYAPSKTFNMAGLIGSYHIIYSKYLRDRITKYGELTHYNEMNILSMHALIGAYSDEGRIWKDELCSVLDENIKWAVDKIRKDFKGVQVAIPEGTYMLFLDFSDYCKEKNVNIKNVLEAGWKVGVGWQDGRMFEGPRHIRMNLALPKDKMIEAFDRLQKYVLPLV